MTPALPLLCDPALYVRGGLYESPDREEALGQAYRDAVRVPEPVAPLFGPASYRRPIDPERIVARPGWRDELAAHYAWVESCFPRVPAAGLYRLGPGHIHDRAIHLDAGDGARPLYETHRAVDLPYLIETGTGGVAEHLRSEDRDHLYLGSVGSFNYGHFLVDDLTRFQAIRLSRPAAGRALCVVLTAHDAVMDPLREAALRLVVGEDVAFEVKFLDRTRRYLFDALLYPSPVTVHPAVKHPAALDETVARAVAAAPPGAAPHRRIFVVRRPERGRALVNAAEIGRILADRRFVTVDPEGLGFAEQVSLFAGAEIVVGQMGAAMGNTLFCRPGARILHLAPTGWTESFYWDLAAARGHLYAACYGPALGDGPAALTDFTIAPSDLFEALERLE